MMMMITVTSLISNNSVKNFACFLFVDLHVTQRARFGIQQMARTGMRKTVNHNL